MLWVPRDEYLWLLKGDQLDDEIVKICNKINMVYTFEYTPKNIEAEDAGFYYAWVWGKEYKSLNPLIAKIKLLKALFKENK